MSRVDGFTAAPTFFDGPPVGGRIATVGPDSIAGSGSILLGTGQLITGANNTNTTYAGSLLGEIENALESFTTLVQAAAGAPT